jgi:hypothetical protein
MKDRVYPEVVWEFQFVGDRRDLGGDGVRANESML